MYQFVLLVLVLAGVQGDFESTTPVSENPEPCFVNDQVGECVHYYQCDKNDNIGDQLNEEIIDIVNSYRNGQCQSYLDVCCKIGAKRTETKYEVNNKEHKCGYLNTKGFGLSLKNVHDEAKFGEFPWMVAIFRLESINKSDNEVLKLNVYEGGGSLIHPSVVLTSAHNAKAQDLRIRAGEWDTQTRYEIYPHQDRDVAYVVKHADFNAGSLRYDVALLFLATPVNLAPHIGVACLPRPDEGARIASRCLAAGWGKDTFGKEGRYQVILKKVELPVVEHGACQSALRRTRLGQKFILHSSFMCAGGEKDKDTCKGDGGSPLVCPIEGQQDRYVQNGIVSWGIGCRQEGVPAVYVDVAKLRRWIDNTVEEKGFLINSYSDY